MVIAQICRAMMQLHAAHKRRIKSCMLNIRVRQAMKISKHITEPCLMCLVHHLG